MRLSMCLGEHESSVASWCLVETRGSSTPAKLPLIDSGARFAAVTEGALLIFSIPQLWERAEPIC